MSLLRLATTTMVLVALVQIIQLSPHTIVAEACSDGYNCNCAQCHSAGYGYVCSSNKECYSHDFGDCALACSGTCEATNACNTCTGGYNCDCSQCRDQGYTYYCPGSRECYSTDATCDLSCGGSCKEIQSYCAAPRDECSAVQRATCPHGNSTCCINSDTFHSFCAPTANATCCNFGSKSCPQGTSCDVVKGTCVAPDPVPTKGCKLCEWAVGKIKGKGGSSACSYVCGLLGPLAPICTQLMNGGLCSYLERKIEGNFTTAHICDDLGACGDNTCSCGYCTPDVYGAWCLSIPNHCPTAARSVVLSASSFINAAAAAAAVKKQTEAASASILRHNSIAASASSSVVLKPHVVIAEEAGPFYHWRFPAPMTNGTDSLLKGPNPADEFCADGICEKSKAGCCLTCAP